MKPLIILEVSGDAILGAVIMFSIAIFLGVFVLSLIISAIIQAIHNSRNEVKYTRKQFWLTTLGLMLLGGIISGLICSGMM